MGYQRLVRMRIVLVLLLVTALLLTAACSVVQQPAGTSAPPAQPVRLTFGAGQSNGAQFPIIAGVVKAVGKYAPNLQVTIMETGGGQDNWNRIEQGEIPLGMFATPHHYALYHGVGLATGKQNLDVRGLVPLNDAANHIVVRADAPIKTLADFHGKKFNAGAAGTQTEVDTLNVLAGLNIQPDLYVGSYADAAERFQNGQLDGFLFGSSVPAARILEIQTTIPIKLVSLSEAEWEMVKTKAPGSPKVTIPAGAYEWLKEDVVTFGVTAAVGTTKDAMSEQAAYDFVKAWHQGFTEFVVPTHQAMALVNDPIEWLLKSFMSPLHAGVIKYLREIGRTIPEELIPPEAK